MYACSVLPVPHARNQNRFSELGNLTYEKLQVPRELHEPRFRKSEIQSHFCSCLRLVGSTIPACSEDVLVTEWADRADY